MLWREKSSHREVSCEIRQSFALTGMRCKTRTHVSDIVSFYTPWSQRELLMRETRQLEEWDGQEAENIQIEKVMQVWNWQSREEKGGKRSDFCSIFNYLLFSSWSFSKNFDSFTQKNSRGLLSHEKSFECKRREKITWSPHPKFKPRKREMRGNKTMNKLTSLHVLDSSISCFSVCLCPTFIDWNRCTDSMLVSLQVLLLLQEILVMLTWFLFMVLLLLQDQIPLDPWHPLLIFTTTNFTIPTPTCHLMSQELPLRCPVHVLRSEGQETQGKKQR